MKKIFKKAHEMTREMKEKYPEVDYQAQFGLCLSYLFEEGKEEEEVIIPDGLKIKIGETDNFDLRSATFARYVKGVSEIKRETGKAILFSFTGTIKRETDDGYSETEEVSTECWLPKSQIKITEGYIYVPEWLVKRNEISFLRIHPKMDEFREWWES